MSRPETSRPEQGRRVRRRVAAGLAAVAVLVPYVVTLALFGQRQSADLTFARDERDGVTYARALVQLVAATADSQSAAVAGRPVDTGRLTEARNAVEAVDARLGASLGTGQRWDDLGVALDAVLDRAPTQAAAYDAWGQVVDLELALTAAVGDTSNLILDPELDTYYVIDAALTRLPRVIALSGRVSDLARLSGGADHDAQGLTDDEREAAGAGERVRGEFANQAAALDRSLRVAFGATRSRTLGPALLNRLDRLRDAANALAPPGDALGVELGSAGVAQDQAARVQVRDAAVSLAASANGEIDALLGTRIDSLTRQYRIAVVLAALAAVGLLGAAWVAAGPRRRPEDADDVLGADERGDDGGVVDDLVLEAEELLAGRRLVRSGRALSSSRDTV
jgi:hypothetical protein